MKRVLQSKTGENHSSPYGSVLFWRNGKRRLGRLEGGAVLPLVVASMFALAFMAGLAIDAGRAYTSRDEVQAAADAAALAGSQARQKGESVATAITVAQNVAVAHGYSLAEVSVSIPPGVGSHAADDKFVRVVISRQHATLIDYGGVDSLNPVGTAIAGGGPSEPIDRCVTILSTADDSISIGNNAKIANPNSDCGIRTMGGIEAGNNAEIGNLRAITACRSGPGSGVVTGQTQEGYNLPAGDPYCNLEVMAMPAWSFSSCGTSPNGASDKITITGNTTISPGVYCKGIKINSNKRLSLNPGVYIIYGGGLELSSNSEITCAFPCNGGVVVRNDGVSSGAYAYGDISIASNATIALPPRQSNDAYNGFLFVQPQQNNSEMTISSGNNIFLGNLFLPGAKLIISANTEVKASSITAWKLELENSNTAKLTLDSGLFPTEEEMKYPTPVLHE